MISEKFSLGVQGDKEDISLKGRKSRSEAEIETGVAFGYHKRGHALRKEDTPMKHFLRDVLAAFVAAVLAAIVVHFLNL